MKGEAIRPLTLFLKIHAEVARRFESPIMTNIIRGVYVEAIVSAVLADHDWKRMTAWDSWDLEHTPSRVRLEVKQAAAAQSWGGDRTSAPRFDIAPRTGYWDSETGAWVEEHGRHAHIYIFAWHGDSGETADQRDPASWCFYVIAEQDLPQQQKTIGLSVVRQMAAVEPCSVVDLAVAVDALRRQLSSLPAVG